jgi:Uncharacterized protein conserved in bacteria (DUF2064)
MCVCTAILTPTSICACFAVVKKELDATVKILLYAPPTDHARTTLRELLQTLTVLEDWQLHPVPTPIAIAAGQTVVHNNNSSHNLSHILSHAVDLGRRQHPSDVATTVVLLGMDAPELPLAEIVAACRCWNPSCRTRCNAAAAAAAALLCPAADGGYGLLVVPPPCAATPAAPAPTEYMFRGVLWSHELTAVSQLKALSDQGVAIVIGPLMHDIDTAHDLDQLVQRLESKAVSEVTSLDDSSSCLSRPSALAQQQSTGIDFDRMEQSSVSCHYTRKVLIDLGLLQASTR